MEMLRVWVNGEQKPHVYTQDMLIKEYGSLLSIFRNYHGGKGIIVNFKHENNIIVRSYTRENINYVELVEGVEGE